MYMGIGWWWIFVLGHKENTARDHKLSSSPDEHHFIYLVLTIMIALPAVVVGRGGDITRGGGERRQELCTRKNSEVTSWRTARERDRERAYQTRYAHHGSFDRLALGPLFAISIREQKRIEGRREEKNDGAWSPWTFPFLS